MTVIGRFSHFRSKIAAMPVGTKSNRRSDIFLHTTYFYTY